MSNPKLHVYVVHRFADRHYDVDHKVIGVYLNKEDAENHRTKLYENSNYSTPHIAVTKHTVRSDKADSLGFIYNLIKES